MIGEILWTPPADLRESTEVGRYLNWLRDEHGRDFASYEELWRWSVGEVEQFWASIWDFYGLRAHVPYERVLGTPAMPGARWFPGSRLNYAEHMVGAEGDHDRIAVVAQSQTRPPRELTFGELPRTLTAKKLELPVKQILLGTAAENVASRDALVQPDALDAFVAYAARRDGS
jgi:acetoacetyl-CoA synthetase